MKRSEFLRLVTGGEEAEYAPVAGMLECGYGFAGYFNSRLNENLEDTCVLINARLIDLRSEEGVSSRPRITDFSDFVEEIVRLNYPSGEDREEGQPESAGLGGEVFGKSIPLAAIPFDEIAVLYPVARIGQMMEELHRQRRKIPSFFDLDNKSIILKLLRTKLW